MAICNGLLGLKYPAALTQNCFRWDGATFYGPKWGLYRAKSTIFNDSDYIFFQNVQMWKK